MEKKGPQMDNHSGGAGDIPELDSYDIIESPLLESLKNVFSLLEPAKQEIEEARRASLSIRSQQQARNESEIVKELQEALDGDKQEIHALKNQRHSCCTDNTSGNAEKGFKETMKSYESKVSDLEKEKGVLKGNFAEIEVAYQDVIRLQEDKLTEIILQNKTKVEKILKEKEETRSRHSRLSKEVAELKRELSENKTRLSKLMGDKLSNKNPDIADLSDNNRPTKLAEKFSELYDNQWTDAYEVAERLFKDQKEDLRIKVLLQLLMDVNKFCQEEFRRQEQELVRVLFRTSKPNTEVAPGVLKEVKDYWKSTAEESIPEIVEKYLQKDTTAALRKVANEAKEFTSGCVSVCWLMVHQDPQVVFHKNVKRLEIADGNFYKAYTQSGKQVDYIVWPALLLHKNGPLLAKGVAQYIKPDEKKNENKNELPKKSVQISTKTENENTKKIQSNNDKTSALTENVSLLSLREHSNSSLKSTANDFSKTVTSSTTKPIQMKDLLAEFEVVQMTEGDYKSVPIQEQDLQQNKQQQQRQQQKQQQLQHHHLSVSQQTSAYQNRYPLVLGQQASAQHLNYNINSEPFVSDYQISQTTANRSEFDQNKIPLAAKNEQNTLHPSQQCQQNMSGNQPPPAFAEQTTANWESPYNVYEKQSLRQVVDKANADIAARNQQNNQFQHQQNVQPVSGGFQQLTPHQNGGSGFPNQTATTYPLNLTPTDFELRWYDFYIQTYGNTAKLMMDTYYCPGVYEKCFYYLSWWFKHQHETSL